MKPNNPTAKTIPLPVALLREALGGLKAATDRKSRLPILKDTALVRLNGALTLTATDLDHFLTFTALAEPEPRTILERKLQAARRAREHPQNIAIVAPMPILRDACKAADKGTDVILSETHASYEMNGQRVLAKLWPEKPLPADDFPPLPRAIEAAPFLCDEALRARVMAAMQCRTYDETRYILQGVYFDKHDRAVCGTDGRHLFRGDADLADLPNGFILPDIRVLHHKPFAEQDWQLRVSTGELSIVAGAWTIQTKPIEGVYPNYRQVSEHFPKPNVVARFGNAELVLDALEKLPKAADTNFYPLKMTVAFTQGEAAFIVGDTSYRIPTRSKFAKGVKEVRLTMQRQYWQRAFEMDLTSVETACGDAPHPIVFRGELGLLVAMPMRPD